MSFSNYLENQVLNALFGGDQLDIPATLYIGLSVADPTETGSGISEPAGGSYARAAIANDKTTWSTSTAGQLQNEITIAFPQATGSWGTVTHFFISDDATSGNILAYAELTTPKTISDGDTASFASQSLVITLD